MAQSSPSDIDDLPSPPRRPVSASIILWLGIIGMLTCFLPQVLLSSAIRQAISQINSDLETLQQALNNPMNISTEEQDLQNELSLLRREVNQLGDFVEMLQTSAVDWAGMMRSLGAYDTLQMDILSITQNGRQLSISGQAEHETIVMAYAAHLRQTPWFRQVTIQSLILKPTPSPTPEGAATSTPLPPNVRAPRLFRATEFVLLADLSAPPPSTP